MITLTREPRLTLVDEGTLRYPKGADKTISVQCLCYHEFFGWCVLTYDGAAGGWYARDEHIYSEQMIHAAWVLPKASDVLKLKPDTRKARKEIRLTGKRKGG